MTQTLREVWKVRHVGRSTIQYTELEVVNAS